LAEDWFAQQAEPELPEGELPDWFAEAVGPEQSSIEAGVAKLAPVPAAAQPAAELGADEFDWDAKSDSADVFDFLKSEPEEEAPLSSPGAETPDWLNWGEPSETPSTPGQLPDWLTQPSEQESGSAPGATAWDSDWAKEESALEETGEAGATVSPFSFLEEEEDATAAFGVEPGWETPGMAEEAQPAAPTSDEPDWLASLTAPDSGQIFPFEDGSNTGSTFGAPGISTTAPAFTGMSAEDQPDWLQSGFSAEPGKTQLPSVPAFSFEDEGDMGDQANLPLGTTPDWIAQVSAEDVAMPPILQAGEEEPTPEGETLERANLPGWLEAMRPIDAIALEDFKDTSDERVETMGPLAGLRGVLPTGADMGKVLTAPAHGLKLRLTEETNAQVKLLKTLVEGETQPYKAKTGAEVTTGTLVRLVLFVVLMLTVIWALWYGEQPSTADLKFTPLTPAMSEFQLTLSMLPDEPVVLVAVEVEAAYSGEMDAVADALMTFLAARRAQLVFISSSSPGPILAEYYIGELDQQAARGGIPYQKYVNLGYLPGGPAGVISFLNAPERVTTFDLQGQPAWETLPATTVTGMDAFDAVVVMTSSSDAARLWVEQAGPILQNRRIPLLFCASAQVAPILQPYFDTLPRQIDGIMSGLTETYQFAFLNGHEQLAGEPSTANELIDAYSAVILAAVLIVLVGIVVNLVSTLLPARSKEKQV
jgi:hypothetical protein